MASGIQGAKFSEVNNETQRMKIKNGSFQTGTAFPSRDLLEDLLMMPVVKPRIEFLHLSFAFRPL
jgi:hypothetical protein